jgi:hypothetical protein
MFWNKRIKKLENAVKKLEQALLEKADKEDVYIYLYPSLYHHPIKSVEVKKVLELLMLKCGVTLSFTPSKGPEFFLKESQTEQTPKSTVKKGNVKTR